MELTVNRGVYLCRVAAGVGIIKVPAQLFVEPAILIVRTEVLFDEVFLAF
jgi:hypothetical protein